MLRLPSGPTALGADPCGVPFASVGATGFLLLGSDVPSRLTAPSRRLRLAGLQSTWDSSVAPRRLSWSSMRLPGRNELCPFEVTVLCTR